VRQLPEWLEQPEVTGLAADVDQTRFALAKLPRDEDILSVLFEAMAGKANIDMIAGSGDHVTFTVKNADKDRVTAAINERLKDYSGWSMEIDGVAKVSAVGVGMNSTTGVAWRFFSALRREKIDVMGVSTSEINISVLVATEHADRALMSLAREFSLIEANA
jgi:aspartate kinase